MWLFSLPNRRILIHNFCIMDQSKVIKLHTASLVDIEVIQDYLEQNNISTSIRDEFNEGLHAGFPNGIPNEVSLMVMKKDFEQAEVLLKEFLASKPES